MHNYTIIAISYTTDAFSTYYTKCEHTKYIYICAILLINELSLQLPSVPLTSSSISSSSSSWGFPLKGFVTFSFFFVPFQCFISRGFCLDCLSASSKENNIFYRRKRDRESVWYLSPSLVYLKYIPKLSIHSRIECSRISKFILVSIPESQLDLLHQLIKIRKLEYLLVYNLKMKIKIKNNIKMTFVCKMICLLTTKISSNSLSSLNWSFNDSWLNTSMPPLS